MQKHSQHLRVVGGALAAVLAVGLAGCSTPTDGGTSGGGNELTTVRLGNLVYTGTAPLQLGIEQGFFEDEGLNIVQTEGDNPAAIAGQLTSGQLDIGFTTTTFLPTAVSQGAPLKAIAAVDGLIDTEAPASAIVVAADSPITTLSDLEGKNVAVVALGSELHLLTLVDVDKAGGDSSKVSPVQIPFPQMQQALDAGNVDAIVTTEPFLSATVAAGARIIAAPEIDIMPGASVTAWAASTSYIEANPKVVDAFIRAMKKTLDYSKAHPDEVLALIPEYTGLDPEQLKDMSLGTIFESELNTESIEAMTQYLFDYKFIEKKPSLSDLVYEPSS